MSRIANVFRRERIATDLDEELRFHVDQRTEEFVRDGMPRGEAELRARQQLGNALLLRESSYETKAAAWLDATLRDFQFGLRMLRKHPGFAAMGTIILALGIGATTAVFSMINAMLLRPLPYPNSDRLVSLYEPNPHIPGVPLGAFGPMTGDFFDWKKESRSFSSMALFTTDLMNMAVNNNAVRVNGSRVTGDFFQLLGVSPAIGRGVEPGDEKGPDKDLIRAVVEMKHRNPTWGCPQIAEQINWAFGTSINRDFVRRILAQHYRPMPREGEPSWLTLSRPFEVQAFRNTSAWITIRCIGFINGRQTFEFWALGKLRRFHTLPGPIRSSRD